MSRDERANEAAFVKERWNLVQKGVECKNVKLRGNHIYVNNNYHGSLIKGDNGYFSIAHVSPTGSW